MQFRCIVCGLTERVGDKSEVSNHYPILTQPCLTRNEGEIIGPVCYECLRALKQLNAITNDLKE